MQATCLKIQPTSEAATLAAAATALRSGELIVFPTDTVYGVAASAGDPAGEQRIFQAKARDPRKPIPLLAADLAAVTRFGVRWTPAERRLARRFWPGALTLILQTAARPEGIRVPDHPAIQRLLRACGGVLRVTSANLSGQPPARTAAAARACLGHAVALILDGGPITGGIPSTVAQVEKGAIRILRHGALPAIALARAMGRGTTIRMRVT